MNITIDELQQICDQLVDTLKKRDINKIAFTGDENYYQIVMDFLSKDAITRKPENLEYGLGLISDDLEFLKDILRDEDEYLPCAVSLGKLGAVLRAVAEKITNNIDQGKYAITLEELSKLFEIHMEYLDMWDNDIISFSEADDKYVLVKNFNHPDTIYTLPEDTQLEYGSLSEDIKYLKKLLENKDIQPKLKDFAKIGIVLSAVSDTIHRM